MGVAGQLKSKQTDGDEPMSHKLPTMLAAAIALTCSGLAATPVLAQSTGSVIKIEDLNLSSEAGRATLDRRITSAERQQCANAGATGSRTRAAQTQKACMQDVRRQAEMRIPAAREL